MDLLFVGVGITYSVCVWGGCCISWNYRSKVMDLLFVGVGITYSVWGRGGVAYHGTIGPRLWIYCL